MIRSLVKGKLRVKLTCRESCARIRELARESDESPRSYLAQLIETVSVTKRLSLEEFFSIDVNKEVAAWLAEHRSGKIRSYIDHGQYDDIVYTIPDEILSHYEPIY